MIYQENRINDIMVELLNNKVFILPTDTVWGIISINKEMIYRIKKRPLSKKIVLFIFELSQIKNLPTHYIKILSKYLPGQLTIIYNNESYRIPNNKFILSLLKKVGSFFCSSANISSCQPITSIEQAQKVFSKYNNIISYVMPSQNLMMSNVPSTIVNLDNMTVVRNGIIDGYKIINDIKNLEVKR